MKISLVITFILFIVALVVAIPSFVFIGIGYVISLVFKISLFNATVLCTVSTFVFSVILLTILYILNTFMKGIDVEDYIYHNTRKVKRKPMQGKIHAVE